MLFYDIFVVHLWTLLFQVSRTTVALYLRYRYIKRYYNVINQYINVLLNFAHKNRNQFKLYLHKDLITCVWLNTTVAHNHSSKTLQ